MAIRRRTDWALASKLDRMKSFKQQQRQQRLGSSAQAPSIPRSRVAVPVVRASAAAEMRVLRTAGGASTSSSSSYFSAGALKQKVVGQRMSRKVALPTRAYKRCAWSSGRRGRLCPWKREAIGSWSPPAL